MIDDPIVAEIRELRRKLTAKFAGDLHAICEDLRRQERESGREFVTLPPRRMADGESGKAARFATSHPQ